MTDKQIMRYRIVVIALCTLCSCLAYQARSEQQVSEWREAYIQDLEERYDDYAYKHGPYPPPQPTVKPIPKVFSFD